MKFGATAYFFDINQGMVRRKFCHINQFPSCEKSCLNVAILETFGIVKEVNEQYIYIYIYILRGINILMPGVP